MAREVTQGALRLDGWARAKGLTDDALGELLGMHGMSVWRIRHGHHRPRFSTMEAMALLTGGFVMPNDWISADVNTGIALATLSKVAADQVYTDSKT
jgi:transcriptional regulator with XRE-family HTH domain